MAQNNDVLIPKTAIDGITKANTEIVKLDESTYKFISTVEKLSKELKDNNITLAQVQKAQKKTAENSKTAAQLAEQEAKAKEKQRLATEKAGKSVLKSLSAETQYFKELKKSNKEKEAAAKITAKQAAKENEFQKALNLTIKSEKDLAVKTAALTKKRYELDKTTKSGQKEFNRLTKEINKNNLALQKSQKSTGVATRGVGKYAAGIKRAAGSLMGALGITAGLYGFVRALGSVIKTSKDFEKQGATLAGVLDVNKSEIVDLQKQAIKLGGEYPTLASEVIKLQTSYARLGFTQREILDLTEDTIKGSFALNSSLDDTAELVGAVVKAYDNLKSTDAEEIIDQLTKSTQVSSLNFEALSTALPKVAGAANALNIPLSVTLATLGTAIDATQDASIAGTSYRKILLSNAKAQRSLSEGLEIINLSTNKVSKAQELYGDRAAVVALALANQEEKTRSLTEAIEQSTGVSSRTAAKQMDTLQGSIDGVSSSWEKLTLNMTTSDGIFSRILKRLVDDTAELIDWMDMANKSVGDIKKEVSDGILADQLKDDRDEVERLSLSLQSKGVPAIQANKQAIDLLLTSYLELREGVEAEERQGVQESINQLRRLAAEFYTTEKEKADKLKELLDAESSEDEANAKKIAETRAKVEEKRLQEAKTAAEQYKTTWVTAVKELSDEIKSQVDEESKYLIDIFDAELDAEIARSEDEIDEWAKKEAAKTKATEDEAAKREAINEKSKELVIAAINSSFDIYQNSLDRKSQANETQKAYELQLADGNANEEAAINAKFEQKQIELNKKKDRSEKAQALFNIALSTAQAIASVSPVVPLMILAGALGAIQFAVAASQPLPQYWTGIDKVPTDGPVVVGDRGRELIKKDGKFSIANQPTVTTGLKGAKVYNNKETEMLLNGRSGGSSIDISELKAEQKETNEILRKMGKLPIHKKGTYDIFKDQIKYPV